MPFSRVWWVSSLRSSTERRVLGLEAVQRGAELVVVGLGAGLDGDRRAPTGGASTAGTRTGMFFGASVSPVPVSASLATAAMSPATTALDRLLLLAAQVEQAVEPLGRLPVRGFTSWSSAFTVPDSTLNSESWPT